MILVPVKNLANAKQRLAARFDQSQRTELAHAMLQDVLDALAESAAGEVALVTSDPFATQLAGKYGFCVIRDEANRSETDAIEMATQVCESRGMETTLVIPGDIPLISADELGAIYDAAHAKGSVLVSAADKRGTNAVLRRPASLFPLLFGNDSFAPHHAAAIATNLPCVVLHLPGIALDVDNPEDLRQLVEAPGEKRSQVLGRRLMAGLGFKSSGSDLAAART